MALDYKLEYWTGSAWTDITNYIDENGISFIEYKIDNRIQGQASIMQIVLDSSATYGSNKYKLSLGTDYVLLKPPEDGIDEQSNDTVIISLVDLFFFQLADKMPKDITGEGSAARIGYGDISIEGATDFKTIYQTGDDSFSAENFTSKDSIHFKDHVGNLIKVTTNPRYGTKGIIASEDGSVYDGEIFVRIKDILNGLITDEGLTIDIDELIGSESTESDSALSCEAGTKKIWYARRIGDYIVIMYSLQGSGRLRSYDLSGTIKSTYILWNTRDWDEGNTGVHNLFYQFFVDEWNSDIYVPTWRCAAFNPIGANDFLLRVKKVNLNQTTGVLALDYVDDYSDADVFTRTQGGITWTDFQDRRKRWFNDPSKAFMFNAYCDEDVGFRLIVGDEASDEILIIDPDRHEAPLANWKYTYALDYDLKGGQSNNDAGIVIDYMNGRIVVLVYDSGDSKYKREYCKVNMEVLQAADSYHSSGADENYCTSNPTNIWNDGFDCGGASGKFYHTDQLPEGIFTLNLNTPVIFNPYSNDYENYPSFTITPTTDRYNPSFSYKDNFLFAWEPDNEDLPTDFDWESKHNYEYKRIWFYQPYAYIDRRQQFIDAFVSFGFFYEQRDGNVRLLRIDGSGSNYGTFTDANILLANKLTGFTNYANVWTINILQRKLNYGTGDKRREITTIMGSYGWLSKMLTDKYMDWYSKLNLDNDGMELHVDLGEFYDIASTYQPKLGNKFTYDSVDYNIIGVKIDLKNWVIEVIGVEDV